MNSADTISHHMSARPCILIVEDDREIAEMLAAELGNSGLHAEIAGDGRELNLRMSGTTFDLIVLDLMSVSYTHLTLPTSDLV